MKKGRLEAFSDAVLAIILTIMVLEMKAPEDTTIASLLPIIPVFLSYVLSFIYIAIYWINHHHLFQITENVSTSVLWANMHLLFWLSLIPFTTSWMGENHLEAIPVAFYGGVLLMSAVAYRILELTLVRLNKNEEVVINIFGQGRKEKISLVIYFIAIPLAFVHIAISIVCYIVVTLLWILPNREVEKGFVNRKIEE
ncbi:MAG: TMEM175 family protein [Bacteroidales bacterium]|nr:TMEM175 family protein [Bacteroidales bacterium]